MGGLLGIKKALVAGALVVVSAVGAAGAPVGMHVAQAAAQPSWSTESVPSGTGPLYAIACPSSSKCFAVGTSILATENSGATWTTEPFPVPVSDLYGIACPSVSDCYAVGQYDDANGVILATTDGGSTWVSQPLPVGVFNIGLSAVSCMSTTQCVAVLSDNTSDGPVLATGNGGSTWTNEPVPAGVYGLSAVSCVRSTSVCVADGLNVAVRSTDGGDSWTSDNFPNSAIQQSIACATVTACATVGGSDTTPTVGFTSSTGGATWNSSTVPSGTATLTGVDCITSTACVAVGTLGFPGFMAIVVSSNGGSVWNAEIPPAVSGDLAMVACPSTTSCVAVGQTTAGDGLIADNGSVVMFPDAQSVRFTSTAPSEVTVGAAPYEPQAQSSSGLTPAITIDPDSSGCSLVGTDIHFNGLGTCVIDANQAGNGEFTPAPQVQQVIPVLSPPVDTGTLTTSVVGMAALPDGYGYWLASASGGVSAHGSAQNYGSMAGRPLNSPIAHIVSTADGLGYWLVAGDGGTFAFGDAGFFGSMGGQHLNAPVVDMAPTPDGRGYWLVAGDGGIFAFGDARFKV